MSPTNKIMTTDFQDDLINAFECASNNASVTGETSRFGFEVDGREIIVEVNPAKKES